MRNNLTIPVLVMSLLAFSCDLTDTTVDDQNSWTKGKTITQPDDSAIPDSTKLLYWEDAGLLALRDVQADSAAKYSLIEIPDELMRLYYAGLIHIYQAEKIPERDSVVSMYKIHMYSTISLHSLLVGVDSSKEWTRAWRNGRRLTGNAQVDDLMERYSLELDGYYSWPDLQLAVLRSQRPLNILALGQSFGKVSGVIYAEPNGMGGDGNNITASIQPEFLRYVFSVGYGDCPAGCIARHFWEFQVRYDGEVTFVRSYGFPPPLSWS
jgi:hypothetical protein